MSNVTFDWTNLEADYCWTGPQQFMDDIFEKLVGTMPGGTGVFMGSELPPSGNNGDIWVRTNYDGTPEGIYVYSGNWLRPHPIPPSGPERMIYVGTEASLESYDGGDSDPVTDRSGPFWEKDENFDFRFPVGFGESPAMYDDAVDPNTIAIAETGGDERVTLDVTETPEHSHFMFTTESVAAPGDADAGSTVAKQADSTPTPGEYEYEMQKGTVDATIGKTSVKGDGKSHQNMPPFIGVIFAKRTARQFYIATV